MKYKPSGKPWKKGQSGNPGGQTKNQRALRQAWAEYLESNLSTKTGKMIKRLDAIFDRFDKALFKDNERWALEFAMNHIAPKSIELSGEEPVTGVDFTFKVIKPKNAKDN